MPRLTPSVPKYRKHKQSGQAIVTLSGRDHLLGPHGTKASKREYDRLITEWLMRGRKPTVEVDDGLTVVEAIARYWKHALQHYVKNGKPTDEQAGIRSALRFLKDLYGDTAASEFSPLGLKSVRAKMVDAGLARSTVNQHVGRLRRMFKWLAAEQLVPVAAWQSLIVVEGLRKGRTIAREPEPIGPVDDAIVDATLPHLPEVVADAVRFQRLTGCRPNEVCSMRPRDVDRSGDVWIYTPESHKTEHHGGQRVIAIGPKAQDVLLKYLARDAAACCFRPCDSESKRRAARSDARATPLSCGDRPGTNRKHRPGRFAGDSYNANSLRKAIQRACIRAFPAPADVAEDPAQLRAWRSTHRWAPNQLRHAAATEIRRRFGLEAASDVLGHTTVDMTSVYAQRSTETATRIARQIG